MSKLINRASLWPAHLGDIMKPRVNWSSRILDSSFFRIPSVSSFKIKPREKNMILKGTGLDRSLPSEVEREVVESNNSQNKYMEYKIKCMKKALRDNKPHTFWLLVDREMRRSTAFRVSAFNTVLKGWYKDRDLHSIFQILNGVNQILRHELTDLKYFRVVIPKGTPTEILDHFEKNPNKAWPGKTRPLGVPTAPWRVVLHMWNGFLTLFLEHEIKKYNHAFMPKVGTNTALKSFVEKVPSAQFIYEFDLVGYFNNVSIVDVLQGLAKRGTPFKSIKKLLWILSSSPKNMSYFDDHTTKYDETLTSREWYKTGIERVESIFEMAFGNHKFNNNKFEELIEEYLGFSVNGGKVDQALKGLPQGAAPSTILSLLVQSDWYNQLRSKNINILLYADDGIMYSNEEFNPFPPEGFEFATDKSGWIKKGTEYLKDSIKFLGLKYDFQTSLFEGNTRNGSTLKFGEKQLEVLELVSMNSNYQNLMEALVNSGIWGLILSKLYGGNFGRLNYEEKAVYTVDSYWGKNHNIVGLSRDPKLQRLASTISCEWLILQFERSRKRKGKAWLKSELRKWRDSPEIKIQLQELKSALLEDEKWNTTKFNIQKKQCHQKTKKVNIKNLLKGISIT